jgi:hypothetical protein
MFHLLTEASIFASLPNECLCQLTGMPLVFLPSPVMDLANSALSAPVPSENHKRKASPHPEVPSLKKRFQHVSGSSEPIHHTQRHSSSSTSRRSPADILFDRAHLCYARPAYIPHTDVITTGLPPKRSCAHMNMRKYRILIFLCRHLQPSQPFFSPINKIFVESTRPPQEDGRRAASVEIRLSA